METPVSSLAGQQYLLNEILNRDVHRMHPTELFRLCHNNPQFNDICKIYRVYIWTTYFEQDILPYLYTPGVHSPSFPNYADDTQVGINWNAIKQQLQANPDAVTNAQIYQLYQQGIDRMRQTAWYFSERLRPAFFMPDLLQPQWVATLGFTSTVGAPEVKAVVQQLIAFTTAQIQNLCRLKLRLQIDPTSVSTGQALRSNTLLLINKRQVVKYMQFAVYSGNADLLHQIVSAWPTWFYITHEDDPIDSLKVMIGDIAQVMDRNVVTKEQGIAMTRVFAKLFVIPTMINPKGRFSATFSEEVKELLRPVIVQNEYQDPWHIAAQSIWTDELDARF